MESQVLSNKHDIQTLYKKTKVLEEENKEQNELTKVMISLTEEIKYIRRDMEKQGHIIQKVIDEQDRQKKNCQDTKILEYEKELLEIDNARKQIRAQISAWIIAIILALIVAGFWATVNDHIIIN